MFEAGQLTTPHYIINFPTKRHWRDRSQIEDIDVGPQTLLEDIRSREIRSIALPALGAGLGGLDWSKVRRRIVATMAELPDVRVIVFEPGRSLRPTHSHRTR